MSVTRFISSKLDFSAGNGRMGRKSNAIARFSVSISFIVMILSLAVVDGFKVEIRSKLTGFMGSALLTQPGISPIDEQYFFSENLSYINAIDSLCGASSIRGAAYRSGLVKTDDQIEGLHFKGVEGWEGDINDVKISASISKKTGLKVGDKMTVYFIGDEVKVRRFTVSGIFDSQLDEIDNNFAFVDIRQIRRVNEWPEDAVSSLEIYFPQEADMDEMTHVLTELVALRSSDSDAPLVVNSVKHFYPHLFDWLSLLDLNVMMILILMVAVAGFNMISAVLIILFEKTSMIGLLKSIGMTTFQVGKVFLMYSASLVGKGLVIGNVIGIALCLLQKHTHLIRLESKNYFVDFVPISLDFWQIAALDIAAFVLIVLIVSLSTGFISKVSPEKTLKAE